MKQVILVGAGGHAKVIAEIAENLQWVIMGFIDQKVSTFRHYRRLEEIELPGQNALMAFGGVQVESLIKRYEVFVRLQRQGAIFPVLIDQRAICSLSSEVGHGVTVNPGAVINADAKIGDCSLINTSAVIEHDAVIGRGVHVGPGAMILGGATVGDFCMIGAGAIVLPYQKVPEHTLVPALTRFPRSFSES